jgi:hypothetical protein
MLEIARFYPLFGVPTLVGCLVVWLLARKRIRLTVSDGLLLIAPAVCWFSLLMIEDNGKSLSNLVELVHLGYIVPILFAGRVIFSMRRPGGSRAPAITLLASCLVAASLWAFVPGLPE